MTDLPAPLTPADCDLRGYEFMPLFGDRLFTSATWIGAKPEAKIAALRLWWHSYAKEVPAASLPDDDALLSDYAGYGVAVAAWKKVKASALRGWVKCSDGRLYHKTVAEIALESWSGRKESRTEADRKKRERADRARMFTELAEHDITPPWNIKTGDLRDLHKKHVTQTSHGKSVTCTVTGNPDVTARQGEDRTGKDSDTTEPSPPPPESSAAGGPAAPPKALTNQEWFSRVDGLIADLPGINRTTGGLANIAPLRALVEPTDTTEKPCDWLLDVIPAARAVAKMLADSGDGLRSWAHPALPKLARQNRDARLNGGKPHDRSTGPNTGGPKASAIDRARLRRQTQPERQDDDGESGSGNDEHRPGAEAHH